jgi:hypothetical protein
MLGSQPSLMQCIKLGELGWQVMCRLAFVPSVIVSHLLWVGSDRGILMIVLSREGKAQACDCEQSSWRN